MEVTTEGAEGLAILISMVTLIVLMGVVLYTGVYSMFGYALTSERRQGLKVFDRAISARKVLLDATGGDPKVVWAAIPHLTVVIRGGTRNAEITEDAEGMATLKIWPLDIPKPLHYPGEQVWVNGVLVEPGECVVILPRGTELLRREAAEDRGGIV